MLEWLAYLGASAIILHSGTRLCRETDALAQQWGWTRSWAGLVLLATVTSLPELFTGISAIAVADTPRIALGDVAGSLAFNLAILGFLLLPTGRPVLPVAGPGQFTVLHQAAALTLLAAALFVAAPWLGPASGFVLLALPVLYALAMLDQHRKGVTPPTEATAGKGRPLLLLWHATLIVGAAGILPYAGAAIADATGLGRTFVGGLFVAVSTSLPELAVTLAAWRMGAPDLAIGNLVGSNLFDLALLGIDEALYPGPLLAVVETGHLALVAVALAMTGLLVLAMRFPHRFKGQAVGAAILLLYAIGQVVSLAGP